MDTSLLCDSKREVDLHCEVYGQGEPLVILHGLFGSLENWRTVSTRLASHFKVVALDQRNHGSSPHSFEMDYGVMARDVLETMKRHAVRDGYVLGHSMGGKTAMQLALTHAEAVRKLIVVDMAPGRAAPRHDKMIAAMLVLNLSQFQTRKEMESALAPTVPDLSTRQFLLKNLQRTEQGGFHWKIGLKEIAKNYNRLLESVKAEKPFQKPTLFIRGEKSDFLRDSDSTLIQHLFPRALLQTISGAGHLVHFEKPDSFVTTVVGFLRDA